MAVKQRFLLVIDLLTFLQWITLLLILLLQ